MGVEEIGLGFESCRDAGRITRHSHPRAYAALVLRGGYVEAGDNGRRQVGVGDILIHGRYEAHQNLFGLNGADILNLPCPQHVTGLLGRIDDPDRIARIAERDLQEASQIMFAELAIVGGEAADWPDLLAHALDSDAVPSIADWAEAAGLAPASVSRGFKMVYGTSPQRFRADRRACRAVQAIAEGAVSLARLAAEAGFADQAHMSREVVRLTGYTPRYWQVEAKCVQASSERAC